MKRKIPSLDKRYSKHRPVTDDEVALWLKAATAEKPTPAPKPKRAKTPDKPPVAKAEPVPAAPKKRRMVAQTPVLDKVSAAQIRRGKTTIDATLDLHGHTRDTAFLLLLRFLAQAQARGVRTALIITGKGKGGEGVLRQLLPLWLNESPLRERIIAYDNASAPHGGSGAWYVRIRKSTTHAYD